MSRYDVKGRWVNRIPELLAAKGQMLGLDRPVTVDEMASEIGVSRQTVYTWISGRDAAMLAADSAAKLERYFGIKVWSIWRLEVEGVSENELGQQAAVATA